MTTILVTFLIALVLSLVITPLAGKLGVRFGALDVPHARKVHSRSIPRVGGLAIVAAFLFTIVLATFFKTSVSQLFVMDRHTTFLLLGALIVFGVGLFDDFYRLGPGVKFLFQIIGASVAFWGGIRIGGFVIFGISVEFGVLSYFVTVFWFLLFINAINLIDGLDGLAAGVCFFTCAVMVIILTIRGNFLSAMIFSALAGVLLGFLRYNFNPASVFMGDGGSYFLGYTIAGLSVMGSYKSQVGATILIPVLALGVPIFDAILSPIRRFVLGQEMFKPDKMHIHHRLVAMGLSTRKIVLIAYGITCVLCLSAILLVNLRDELAGLFLIILGAGVFVSVKKLGYLEYVTSDKIFGWFRDVTDGAGLSRERRSFLKNQIQAGESESLEELWQNIIRLLDMLKFDRAELSLGNFEESEMREAFVWTRGDSVHTEDDSNNNLLKIELPLLDDEHMNFGTLNLLKDLRLESSNPYTLRRVEQLRMTLVSTLVRLRKDDKD